MQFLTDVYKRYEVARKYLNEHSVNQVNFNPLTLYRGLKLKTFNNANQLIDNYVSNEKYVSYSHFKRYT